MIEVDINVDVVLYCDRLNVGDLVRGFNVIWAEHYNESVFLPYICKNGITHHLSNCLDVSNESSSQIKSDSLQKAEAYLFLFLQLLEDFTDNLDSEDSDYEHQENSDIDNIESIDFSSNSEGTLKIRKYVNCMIEITTLVNSVTSHDPKFQFIRYETLTMWANYASILRSVLGKYFFS